MRERVFIISVLSALLMGVVYDKINQATGIEITALLYAAIATLFYGLYAGLYTNNKKESKKRS